MMTDLSNFNGSLHLHATSASLGRLPIIILKDSRTHSSCINKQLITISRACLARSLINFDKSPHVTMHVPPIAERGCGASCCLLRCSWIKACASACFLIASCSASRWICSMVFGLLSARLATHPFCNVRRPVA
jgi:hypothetical protein